MTNRASFDIDGVEKLKPIGNTNLQFGWFPVDLERSLLSSHYYTQEAQAE
jgi:hypothetical protein